MSDFSLRDEHARMGARFDFVNGVELVRHYGDPRAEHAALRATAGLFDLSARGRLVLTGGDRQRFLNGQVTNNVKDLRPGEGCYAMVVNAKARVEGDLNIYCLAEELLLDCEPAEGKRMVERLERFVVADDVQVIELGAEYGLLSVQGPEAEAVMGRGFAGRPLPGRSWGSVIWREPDGSEACVVKLARAGLPGFELFVPRARLREAWRQLNEAVAALGGRACGWESLEWGRVEAGLPRYGQDLDERNLAPEAGNESRAISYTKGCYIGQEIISRIRSIGQVTRRLSGLEFEGAGSPLPRLGDRLYREGREVGYVTSAIELPALARAIGLGYVRREAGEDGTALEVRTESGSRGVRVRRLPFLGSA